MSQSRRRQFLISSGALLVAPLAPSQAFAQQAKTWRIGILAATALPSPPEKHPDFGVILGGMADLGYVSGKNVRYEWRTAGGEFDRLPKLASELVSLGVDLLIVQSTPGVRAARQATGTIPIVFIGIGDPIGSGLVASLAKPGGNITGVANMSVALDGKRVELLAEVVTGLSRIGVMLNPSNPTYPLHVKEFGAAAEKRGLRSVVVAAQTPKEIDKGFETLRQEHAGALIVQIDTFFQQRKGQIAISAAAARMPTMFGTEDYVDAGGLMSYGHRSADLYRKVAEYVDKIFKGANPGTMPVEQPTNFVLAINARTARTLGITIPQSILFRADRVIE